MRAWILGLIVLGVLAAPAETGGGSCWVHEAASTRVWYVPTDAGTTAVVLIASCHEADTVVWYVSYFVGDQPSLWEYWQIQNTASELLRPDR